MECTDDDPVNVTDLDLSPAVIGRQRQIFKINRLTVKDWKLREPRNINKGVDSEQDRPGVIDVKRAGELAAALGSSFHSACLCRAKSLAFK